MVRTGGVTRPAWEVSWIGLDAGAVAFADGGNLGVVPFASFVLSRSVTRWGTNVV